MIIENINQNLDSLIYDKKIVEDGVVSFIVGDIKMTFEEYKEYCFTKELEKRRMDKMNIL